MKYLTEAQERNLRALIDANQDRNALKANYPPARTRGSVTLASGRTVTTGPTTGVVAQTVPRMRVFGWVLNETASSRRTIAFPVCTGYAIIRDFEAYTSTYTSPINQTLEFGWATTDCTEAGVGLATPRPYNILTEMVDPFAQVADAAGQGVPYAAAPPTHGPFQQRLDLVVTQTSFRPVLALVNNTANVLQWIGTIRILEGLTLEQMMNAL